jgi:hypothetical protein
MKTSNVRVEAAIQKLTNLLNEFEKGLNAIDKNLKVEVQQKRESDLKAEMRGPIMAAYDELQDAMKELDKERLYLLDPYAATMLKAVAGQAGNAEVILASQLPDMAPERLVELSENTLSPALVMSIRHEFVKKQVTDIALMERLKAAMARFIPTDEIARKKNLLIIGWKVILRHITLHEVSKPDFPQRKLHIGHVIADLEK